MDSKTTIAQLRKRIDKVEKDRGWNPNAKDLTISVSLEAAELMEHFQWSHSETVLEKAQNDSKKKDEIEMEVADIIIYLCQFMSRLDIDLSDAVGKKIKKIDEKYPAAKIKAGGDEFYYQQKKKYRQK